MVGGLGVVSGGGGVVRGLVVVSLVAGLVVVGVVGLALVPHIGDVAGVAVVDLVGDDLGPAVGKGDAVLAVGGIAVPVLVLAKVGARVVILNTILVGVSSGLVISGLLVGRGGLVGSRGISRGRGRVVGESAGSGHEGRDGNEDLKSRL